MPFSGDTFTKLYAWLTDPQRNEKIFNSRLDDEFGGVATGLTTVAGRVTAVEADLAALALDDLADVNAPSPTDGQALVWDDGNSEWIAGDVATGGGVISADGIAFPATQVASADANTLDDYEEGTWTPTLTFATPGDLAVTYSVRTGIYTKIGRMVFVNFNVVTSAFTHTTASGICRISGFPFTSVNTTGQRFQGTTNASGITKAGYSQFIPRVIENSSIIEMVANGSGVAVAAINAADMPTAGSVVIRADIAFPVQ
jgi:hypothetical protein